MSEQWPASGLPPLFGEDHVCVTCAVSYAELAVPSALALVAGVVVELEALLPDVPEAVLRRRLRSGEWSALEYAGHVRDVLQTFTVRVHRGVVEDRPALEPMYADWRAERFGYNAAAVADVVRGMRVAADGFVAEVLAVPEDAWERLVTRRPTEPRTVRWLVRQTAHEAVHHRDDVRRLVG
jgi:hypothetical protein